MKNRKPNFANTNLITLDRLATNTTDCFETLPSAVASTNFFSSADDDDESPAININTMMCLAVCNRKGLHSLVHLSPIQAAVLCEATRFKGVSLAANTNGSGREYLKATFTAETKDNFPVARLWTNAGIYEAVSHPDNLKDHSLEAFDKSAWGKPEKNARAILLTHALAAAENAQPKHFTPAEYVANLEALLDAIHTEATTKGLAWAATPKTVEGPRAPAL